MAVYIGIFVLLTVMTLKVLSYKIQKTPIASSLAKKTYDKLMAIMPISLSLMITSSSLTWIPLQQPAFAATATLSASKLYEQAENGIVATQKEYKDVENDWIKSKKAIIESSKNLGKSSELIKQLSTELLDYESKINKFVSDYDNVNNQLKPEIEKLKLTTASKFEKAELAQQNNEKLSSIQKLFSDAETEAKLLNHEIELLKAYSTSIGTSNIIVKDKIQLINQDLKKFLVKADDIQILQGK